MQKLTKEDENYIRENLRYDPETGYLWWIKPSKAKRARRILDKPIGYLSKTKRYVGLELNLPSGRIFCNAHRIAWFLYYDSWPTDALDHINGIKVDNRIQNLRPATLKQNNRNRKSLKGSSSKYKGVHWHKQSQKWYSNIKPNYKDKFLGSYTSEEDAARAYDKAARELFGEYACLNFPDEHEQGALHGHDL